MKIAESIDKLGFKRWYERSLIEAHAYLVTCFLGMVLAFVALEMIAARGGTAQDLLGLAAAVAGTIMGVFGWQRYRRLMVLAEQFGDKATCGRCGLYAAFKLLASGPPALDTGQEDTSPIWLKVRCRKCGNEWTL